MAAGSTGAAVVNALELVVATIGGGAAAATAAIALAVGQIARERHTRTLDFLLVRPVPAGVIVWSKFLAGTVVLAVLLAGVVALGYADPKFTSDTGLQAIREQVGMGQLLATLFPRFWFLYALALLFSVAVDRSVKAAALAVVLAITLVALASVFADLAPFSSFVYWLPFFDLTGGLVEAAKRSWLSGMTGLVYSCGAVLVTAASAMRCASASLAGPLTNLSTAPKSTRRDLCKPTEALACRIFRTELSIRWRVISPLRTAFSKAL